LSYKTTAACCFQTVLFMILPHDLPVHHYALYAIQKVHFIITLVLYDAHVTWPQNEVAVYLDATKMVDEQLINAPPHDSQKTTTSLTPYDVDART